MAPTDVSKTGRPRLVWWLALACFLGIFGAKIATVDRIGSDLPTWDQWDAESEKLLLPYEQGRLHVADLFIPHNEHRIVWTKALALGLYLANGQWDARLECTVNAAMHALFAVAVFLFGRRMLDHRWHLAWLATVFALFAAPMSWQNVIGGFHTPQTFLLVFSVAAIACLTTARTFSLRWWAGLGFSVAALFTLGSGLFAAVAAGATLALFTPLKTVVRRHGVTIALCVLIALAGLSLHTSVPYHDVLKAHSSGDFVLCLWRSLQWPVVKFPFFAVLAWLPWAALAWRVYRRGDESPADERIVVASGVWILLQYLASAYARGADGAWPANRYFDTVAFGIAVNALALLVLLSRAPLAGWRAQVRTTMAIIGVVLLAQGWWTHIFDTLYLTGPLLGAENVDREAHTRAFVHTGDPACLREGHIPHPSAETLRVHLSHEEILRILPASVRAPIAISGAATPTGAFAPSALPPTIAGPMGWSVLGSFDSSGAANVGSWTSAPLPGSTYGYWAFPTVTETPDSPGLSLTLSEDADMRTIDLVPRHGQRFPGTRWNLAVVRAPRGTSQLRAIDSTPDAWLAFGAPVEMATGSYWTWRLGRLGSGLFWLGVITSGVLASGLVRTDQRFAAMGSQFWRRLRDMPRRQAIAGSLISALLAGLVAGRVTDLQAPAFFEATIRGKLTGSSIELFYDRGHGIRGADSAQCWFDEEAGERLVRLRLAAGTYRRLRFDPMGNGTPTTIDDARIVDVDGRVLRDLHPDMFQASNEIASITTEGSRLVVTCVAGATDPQLTLTFDPPLSSRPRSQSAPGRWAIIMLAALAAAVAGPLLLHRLFPLIRPTVQTSREGTWTRLPTRAWQAVRGMCTGWSGLVALTTVAVLAVIIVRMTDRFANPQLWAADASIFFVGAESLGPASILQPYDGYLNLIPRLAALVGVWVDPGLLPAVYVWLSAFVLALAAVHVLSPRMPLPLKPLLALAIAAIPHTGEVYLNLSNIQSLTALLLFQMALKDDGVTARQRGTDLVILVLTGLTGPCALLFLPLFAWRAWRRRTGPSFVLLTTVAVCALIQLSFVTQHPAGANAGEPAGFECLNLFAVGGRRLVFSLLTGSRVPEGDSRWFVVIAAGALVAGMLALSMRRDPRRETKLVLWFAGATLLVSAWRSIHFEQWSFHDTINGDRYFFLPKVLLCWLLLIEAHAGTWRGWIARAVLVIGFAASLGAFRLPPLPDYRWRDHCDALRRGEKADIPITPPGWIFEYPGRSR